MSKINVIVCDKLGDAGLEILTSTKEFKVDVKTGLSEEELTKVIGNYEGAVVRSGTKFPKAVLEHADKMRVIGRAGVGVDNVDLDEATKRGIIVMNTPQGNTVSTCEHAFSMMLSLSRNIPQAHANVKSGQWDKSKFVGQELLGKTLGVIGFGRIGREMAKRAAVFGMDVITFDPFISKDFAEQMGVDAVDFEELCKQADYITVHTPLSKETKHILNKDAFKLMKPTVRIINCARGGIIEENDLYEALKAGKVKGVALDVFETEPPEDSPLLEFDNVVVTPHLGAQTPEAQENVAVDVAKQIRDALLGVEIRNAVNLPSMDAKASQVLKPWVVLAERMGVFQSEFLEGNITKIQVRCSGEVTEFPLAPITTAVTKGVLKKALGDNVNFVNAAYLAEERGLEVIESKTTQLGAFTNFISVQVTTEAGDKNLVVGTLFEDKAPRIVRVNECHIDAVPTGHVILVANEDKPGIIGEVCCLLGKHRINIAEMALGREEAGGKALTIFNVDEPATEEVIEEIRSLPKIISAKSILF